MSEPVPGGDLSGLDLSKLEPYQEGHLQVVVETPRGSRNKYAFDRRRHVLRYRKVLPAGMCFPYDFGFVPSTEAEDGDPLDVLLLMDEPSFPGCVLDARPIGVLEGEETLHDGTKERNDRLLAVAHISHTFADVQSVEDLPKQLVKDLQEFFRGYPEILGEKKYRLLAVKGPGEAKRLIDKACR